MEHKPLLYVIHDDGDVRALLSRDLRERFGRHYELEAHADGAGALASLRQCAGHRRKVAAVFAGDSATCGGTELLTELHELHPLTRRVLMVGRGEWKSDHPAVATMRTGQAESYIFVPWGPRERWLYLPVTEILADWEASQPPVYEAAQLIAEEWDPRARALRDSFSQLGVPLGYYRPGSEPARRALGQGSRRPDGLPVLAFRSGTVLVDPSQERIAKELGFATEPTADLCDLAIIGAGPAGLAAAVYGASEGLTTVVIDHSMPGGQAGTSSRIRNYLGFPTGVSGRDLGNRALEQAWFFGARLVLSKQATGIRPAGSEYVIELAGGPVVSARTVIIATGVSWRRLDLPALEALHGAGVFYGAAASDAVVDGAKAFIVGAGNSDGQAAVHLARSAASVSGPRRKPRRQHVRLPDR
jgi:thioredoxin reductase (NADPH)